MTLMAVGVSNPKEAERAIEHGADIVHAMPGADAQSTADAARAIVATVAGRTPVSASTGGATDPATIWTAATLLVDAGVDQVEVRAPAGLRRFDCIRALSTLARRARLVCTIFVGEDVDTAVLTLIAQSGFTGVMLDTAEDGARLLERKDVGALGGFIQAVRSRGLTIGLAGTLETPDIPRLLLLKPDALCLRAAPFSGSKVDVIRALMPRSAPEQAAPRVELDLHRRARGIAEPTDRVFVRDFVLPVRIGAYARERDKPQSVRFDVEARIARSGHVPEDMRDVFSYDIITDSIRVIVREHIALVETLAERIAAALLAYPRVASVTVRVEKLDTGPGGVGVEITRDRLAEAATVHHLFSVRDSDS
jgi:dihydroneopterin aldolase